jgi:hypothetical protein
MHQSRMSFLSTPLPPSLSLCRNLSLLKNCRIFDMATLSMKSLTNQCHCFLSTTLNASTLGLKFVKVMVDRLLNCQLQLQILNLSQNFLSLLRTQMINLCMECQLSSGTLAHRTVIHLARLNYIFVSRSNISET